MHRGSGMGFCDSASSMHGDEGGGRGGYRNVEGDFQIAPIIWEGAVVPDQHDMGA